MRYVKYPCFFFEDELVYFADVYLNPFQIESFYQTALDYKNEDGDNISEEGVKLITKSGAEIEIRMPIDEFISSLE